MSAATVQQVLRLHPYKGLNEYTGKVLAQLKQCRTHAAGYHVYDCDNEDCSNRRQYRYNSCGNRHCPQCGGLQKQQWIEARISELLPVKYYHVVFTMPHQLNSLVMGNRLTLYKLLMDTAWYALQKFGRDEKHLGAELGVIGVLHTWGQQLSFHPHVHCIVSGGGITEKNQWKEAKKSQWDFLFPVEAMMEVYRGRFIDQLQRLKQKGQLQYKEDAAMWEKLVQQLARQDWVVYAKQPFGGPMQVVEYLGRYTHKVAISNHRIQSLAPNGDVTFKYKDYADSNKQKQMTLPAQEFIRRFEQHILPRGFCKIRHYGYLSNRNRTARIKLIHENWPLPPPMPVVKLDYAIRMLITHGINVHACRYCGTGRLTLVQTVYAARGRDSPAVSSRKN